MTAIENLQHSLPRRLDAALILSEHNRRYFTGFPATDGVLFVTRERAVLLEDFRYIEAAQQQAYGCETAMLEDRAGQLQQLMTECGVRTVGIEAGRLTVAEFHALQRELPHATFDDSDALTTLITRLRMVKSAEEIDRIRKSQRITDAAYAHILPFIKPGVTERELALEIEYFMKRQGASGPSFDLIVVSGEKTSLPHGVPGERKIRSGDFVTMDTGAVFEGYCSDMTRTVAVGSVTPAMKHVYDTVKKAQLAAEEFIRAGAGCREVDKAARDIIDNAGYKGCFGHSLGHSVGLEIHEFPVCSPRSADNLTLQANEMMTVEPGVYIAGGFGVRIEDLVVVRENGCEILTQSPKELTVL